MPRGYTGASGGWLHEIAGSLKFVLALLEGGAPTTVINRVIAPINGLIKDGVRTLPTTGTGPLCMCFVWGGPFVVRALPKNAAVFGSFLTPAQRC